MDAADVAAHPSRPSLLTSSAAARRMQAAGGVASGGVAPPDDDGGGEGVFAAPSVELGPDELRCVFAALLTLPEPTRDLGRCMAMARGWRDTLRCSPSLWFALFHELDPAEADEAAAAAPPAVPGAAGYSGAPSDSMRDHDFQRRTVEQFCWRKTNLCSACFAPTPNVGIATWRVRLCSPCMATSVLNKTDSAKQFLLGAKELRELRTWSAGVTAGPFNTAVQFFFRRHLERAAAQKHGAAGGLAAVLRKRADELAAKDAASKIELAAASTRLDALLATHGVARGSTEWHELGLSSCEVDLFLKGEKAPKKPKASKSKKKKERLEAWTDPGAQTKLMSADDAIAAVEQALQRSKRRKLLHEACAAANMGDADKLPGQAAIFAAFVCADDAVVEAPASRRGAPRAATTPRKRKSRGWRSSDEDESSEDEGSASEMSVDDASGDEAAARPAAPGARTGTRASTRAGASGASGGAAAAAGPPAVDLREAARGVAKAIIAQRRHAAGAHVELEALLALAALEHGIPTIADADVYKSSEAYAAFLVAIAQPPAASAAPLAQSAAEVAAAAISAQFAERAAALDGPLEAGLTALVAQWEMPRSRMAQLLGCRGESTVGWDQPTVLSQLLGCRGESTVGWSQLVINDTKYRESYILNGVVKESLRPRNRTRYTIDAQLTLDQAVERMLHQLRLKLRKGEMQERYVNLLHAISSGTSYETMPYLRRAVMHALPSYSSRPYDLKSRLAPKSAWHDYAMTADSLGTLLHSALSERLMSQSTYTGRCDKDINLVSVTARDVNISAACELSYLLDDVAATVLTRGPQRGLFKRWVLDGRIFDDESYAAQTVSAVDFAARILAPERKNAADLVSAIGAVKLETPSPFKFSVNCAPLVLLDCLEGLANSGGQMVVQFPDSHLPSAQELYEQAVRRIIPDVSATDCVLPVAVMIAGVRKQARFLMRIDGKNDTFGQIKARLVAGLRIPPDKAGHVVLRDQRRAILPDDDEVSIILARHYLDAPPAEQCWCPALGFFVDFSAMDVSKDTEESEDALGSSDWLDGLSLDTIPVLYDFSFNGRALPFCSLGDATMADACSSLARLLTEHGLRLPSIGDDALDAISGSDIRFLHAAPDAATTRMDPFKQFRSLSFQITLEGEKAKSSFAALAAKQLDLQTTRHKTLSAAFQKKGSALPALNWDIPTSWDQRDAASAPSLDHALLAFLRGPSVARFAIGDMDRQEQKSLKSILARAKNQRLKAEQTKLSYTRKNEVIDKLSELCEDWSSIETSTERVHATEQSALYQRYVTKAELVPDTDAAGAAAADADADAAVDADADDADDADSPGADAAGSAVALTVDAVVAEVLQLYHNAKGMSVSVLVASRLQEMRGQHGREFAESD